jgi:hypothetical protein
MSVCGLSVLLVEETGGPGENHRPVASHANIMLQCIIDKITCTLCLSLSFIQLCIVVSVFYWLTFICMSVCVVLFIVTMNQNVQNPVVYYTQAQPHYLCPYFRGGLGNLMFMYAALYGIAKTNGREHKLFSNLLFDVLEVFP